jgi:hypothetical protein
VVGERRDTHQVPDVVTNAEDVGVDFPEAAAEVLMHSGKKVAVRREG